VLSLKGTDYRSNIIYTSMKVMKKKPRGFHLSGDERRACVSLLEDTTSQIANAPFCEKTIERVEHQERLFEYAF
jgi:hypothetical protein